MSACDPDDEAVCVAKPDSVDSPSIKRSKMPNEAVFNGAAD
jgi:hypothetical protein